MPHKSEVSQIETVARVRAAIERRADRDAVLREEGLSDAEWMALQRQCLGAVATEISAGRSELVERYLSVAFSGQTPAAMFIRSPQGQSAASPAYSPSPAGSRPAPIGSGTAFAPAEVGNRPATPFGSSPHDGQALPKRSGGAAPNPGSGTVLAPLVPVAGAAVPFKAQEGAAPPLPTAAAQRPPIGTGTVLAPVDASATPATPFQSGPGSPTHGAPREMSLEQYAHVSAALKAATPAELPAVLERFRLTPETRAQLEASWKARMQADPTLAIRYAVLLADHKPKA